MKLAKVLSLVAVLLLGSAATVPVNGQSCPEKPCIFSYEYNMTYYTDATFTVQVGGKLVNIDCSGQDYEWGTTSDYRTMARINCGTGAGFCRCEQFINGSWQSVTCPQGISCG